MFAFKMLIRIWQLCSSGQVNVSNILQLSVTVAFLFRHMRRLSVHVQHVRSAKHISPCLPIVNSHNKCYFCCASVLERYCLFCHFCLQLSRLYTTLYTFGYWSYHSPMKLQQYFSKPSAISQACPQNKSRNPSSLKQLLYHFLFSRSYKLLLF